MRVLIAAGIYPPDAGGPAVHAKAQFEGLREFGFDTDLVAFSHYRRWPRWIRHLFFLVALLRKALRSDLIYAHDSWGVGFPALIAARLTGNKIVIRVGGDLAWERQAEKENISMNKWYENGYYRREKMFILSRFLLRRVDAVVVIGKSLARIYTQVYGVDGRKIKIIFNPVPETRSYKIKREENIIFASRLTNYKNLPMLLRVFAKVLPQNQALKLTIMGDGPEMENLKRLTRELSIERDVVFTGAISLDEVLRITSECLFTIAPALTEFNPNYVLQGIGFGKPFLISRENDLPFQAPEYLMFNPMSDSELYERIISLLNEEEYAKAEQFVKSVNFKMSWHDNLKENTDVILSLLNGSK